MLNCSVCWALLMQWFNWFNHKVWQKMSHWKIVLFHRKHTVTLIFGHLTLEKKKVFHCDVCFIITQIQFHFYTMFLDMLYSIHKPQKCTLHIWFECHFSDMVMLLNSFPFYCKFCILFIYNWQSMTFGFFVEKKYIQLCAFNFNSVWDFFADSCHLSTFVWNL